MLQLCPRLEGGIIAPDKKGYRHDDLSYFSMKTHVVGTHQKCLGEALLMSANNICFHGEIRNISEFFDGK